MDCDEEDKLKHSCICLEEKLTKTQNFIVQNNQKLCFLLLVAVTHLYSGKLRL